MSPLAGLFVVDLSRLLPGPLAARLLADLGARVVKVEEPRLGDPVRLAPPARAGRGALAAILLAGVESVALDLKRAPARAVLDRLLARADVLLDNFRPGTLARLGLDDATLAERYPRLVVCSLSGWGSDGPYAHRAGHDLTYLAAAGALAAVPAPPALPSADLAGAWAAVASILAALHRRQATGLGGRIDAALYDAAVHSSLLGWAEEVGGPRRVGQPLPLSGELPCYGVYRTADGRRLAVAALEPNFWRRLCRVAGRRDLLRHGHRRGEASRQAVAALIAGRTLGEWEALGAAHDLPLEAVTAPAEAAEHPQARARGLLSHDPRGLPRLAFPARFEGVRPAAAERLPGLGEDTDAVLAELGVALPGRERRKGGVGPRWSFRKLAWRWFAGRR